MNIFSARDAKNQFGLLIGAERLDPVVNEKHSRPVVVVCSVEECDRLRRLASEHSNPTKKGSE